MITIFTPTYNRGYILPCLYSSLKRQTSKKFEWIIVDDGSTDNTQKLVDIWCTETKDFPIKYFKQNNAGKHIAINRGVKEAAFEWFFIVDSDDYLVDDAVETIESWLTNDLGHEFAGIAGTRIDSKGNIIGPKMRFISEYVDCRNNQRYKYGLGGDKAEIYKTSILKSYPFPSFDNEKFLSECTVWDKIALDGFKLRWYKKGLIVCEYLGDGLTAKVNLLELNNFRGYTYATSVRLKAYKGIEHYRLIGQFIGKAINKSISLHEISRLIDQNICLIYILYFAVIIKNRFKKCTNSIQ